MVNYGDLVIDKEFQDLLPAPSAGELKQLRADIVRDGCIRDPIDIWKDVVIDGHNRLTIGEEEGVRFPRLRDHPELKTRDDVKVWILRKQLGRRNLSKHSYRLLAGQLYLAAKKAIGAPKGSHSPKKTSENLEEFKLVQFEPINSTAAQIAREAGLSESTVKRGAKDATAIKNLTSDLKTAYHAGKLTDQQAIKLGKLDHSEQDKLAALVKDGQHIARGDNALDKVLGARNAQSEKTQTSNRAEATKLRKHFRHVASRLAQFDRELYAKHEGAINAILHDLGERCRAISEENEENDEIPNDERMTNDECPKSNDIDWPETQFLPRSGSIC